MRLLLTFFQKLTELLTKKKLTEITDEELNVFYSGMFDHKRDEIVHANFEELIEDCKHKEYFSVEKCKLLCELLYIETKRVDETEKQRLIKTTIELIEYYQKETKTFDIEIDNKLTELRGCLNFTVNDCHKHFNIIFALFLGSFEHLFRFSFLI